MLFYFKLFLLKINPLVEWEFLWYNLCMRFLLKALLVISLLLPLRADAASFEVLVLPVDVANVCNNYYCYDEVSNIVAKDIISNFNSSQMVSAPTIETVRAKLNENLSLKSSVVSALNKYKKSENIDMASIKAISNSFNMKSVLLVSSSVVTKNSNLRRGVWEILDFSSGFGVVYPYQLETNAVLIDTVNGLVMWSGSFTKKLGNQNNEFKAKTPSEASVKLEQLSMYSKAIVARSVAQNVTLRFYPKSASPVVSPKSLEDANPVSFFRMNIPETTPSSVKKEPALSTPADGIKGINEGDFGEIIYGL